MFIRYLLTAVYLVLLGVSLVVDDGIGHLVDGILFYTPLLFNAYIDARTHFLRKSLTHYAILVAVVNRADNLTGGCAEVAVAVIVLLILFISSATSEGRLLGRGDVRLCVALLIWHVGDFLLVVFLACLAQGIFALGAIVLRKARRNTRFAFGPWLVGGSLLVWIFEFQNW